MWIPLLVQHRLLVQPLRGAKGIAGRRHRSGMFSASMAARKESLVIEYKLYHMMLYKIHRFNTA